MTWSLVGEVLALLAGGTFAMKWMAREPRPIIVKAPVSASDVVRDSLELELDELAKARDRLLREHANLAGEGYPALAKPAWDSAMAINKRMDAVRQELTNLPSCG